jgi:RND family efflux transporter MFP subunit
MRRHLRVSGAAAVSILLATPIPACSDRTGQEPADLRPPVPVKTVMVAMTDRAETFETAGIVQARTTATMTSRVTAPVVAVRVGPGDRVRLGQILVVLDGRDLNARAHSARAAATAAEQRAAAVEAESRAAEAMLVLDRATHERIAALHAKRSATAQELDDATASLRAGEARAAAAAARRQEATAAVSSAMADSEAASTTESFTRIVAPFDGVVTEKMIEPGNMATPGTPLVRVEDTSRFRLEVRVDESRVGMLATGTPVAVDIETGSERSGQPLQGTVSEVARAVDSDARAFVVKIDLPGVGGLRSGMFGRARLSGATRRVLIVPSSAVVRRGQVTSVFVITDAVARLRMIDLAGVEVRAGLNEGERIIVDPSPAIVDGRRVTEGGGS